MTERSITYNQQRNIYKLFSIICESDWLKKNEKLKMSFF